MTAFPLVPQQGRNELLTRAFHDFDQAATVLQQSYAALTSRLQRMDLELAETNATLREHLRETEQMRAHVTAILESIDTGVIVADRDDRVLRCNQSAERLLGMTQARLRGRPASEVLREIAGNRAEYPLVLPTGAVIALAQTELTDASGANIGKLVLLHDMTRIRQLEDRLQRRNRLEAMGQMVGCIAHEIRNPLGSVELFASMLRKDLREFPQLRTYAEHISVAVQSMDRLLSNLLVYTRPDCSNATWHDTEPLMVDVLTLAAHAISTVPMEVRFELDPLVPHLWCDAAKIKQALLNLVLNAAQAMPEGGTLTLGVSIQPSEASVASEVRVTVSDTGCGIAPEHLARVFDPFFTTKDQGTGLGLAIVHALVEAHQGRIDVESTVGRGTSFMIVLPNGPAHVRAASGAQLTQSPYQKLFAAGPGLTEEETDE
jgi:signal transduction histidine kinase